MKVGSFWVDSGGDFWVDAGGYFWVDSGGDFGCRLRRGETIAGSCPLSLGQIPSLGSLGALVKSFGLGQISFDQKVSGKQLAQDSRETIATRYHHLPLKLNCKNISGQNTFG